MKVAFFGAEGKVGRALVPVLERAGHDVRGFELGEELDVRGLDAVVDFTTPDAAPANVRTAIACPALVRMLWPDGSVSTAIAGCSLPSSPKRRKMCVFASEPAVPGAATACERPLVAEEAVKPPSSVSSTQPRTTRRR